MDKDNPRIEAYNPRVSDNIIIILSGIIKESVRLTKFTPKPIMANTIPTKVCPEIEFAGDFVLEGNVSLIVGSSSCFSDGVGDLDSSERGLRLTGSPHSGQM